MVRQAIPITLTSTIWSGSVLLDSSFTEDGSPVYLRSFTFSVNPQMTFSSTASADDRADLRDEWEMGAAAIEFEAADGETFSMPGPAFPGDGFADPSEPYFWTTSSGVGLVAFYSAHTDETLTLYLESGVDPTTDGPWSEPLGLLTTDSEWSLLIASATQNSEWSELALTTIDSEWSELALTTIDSEWSELALTTIDSEWSVVVSRDPPSRDGEWSEVTGGTGLLPAQPLETPNVSDPIPIDINAGIYSVDITWTGDENHVHLDQVRTRWIARLDRGSGPEPPKDEAERWAESTNRVIVEDFQYVDIISRTPSQAILGPVALLDQSLMDANFADAAFWVMARLEVDDLTKESQAAPGSFTPFHVTLERDASQTVAILFRGSEDLWCVGQMLLQPTPAWEVIITAAGIQGLYAVPFQWNVNDESITLNLTTIVGDAGFILHAVNYLSDGNILFRREWNSPPEFPDGFFGPFVITNTDTTLIVDSILNCP